MPAERACSACARPISPPSAVTAALFDMFCGLNGRTLTPLSAKARASPATIKDLPTSEPVPWNMMARAVMPLKLNPLLRLHPRREVMFHQRHLGDKIGSGNQLRLRVTPCHHDMQL